jgi:YD repeat-containing protein
VSFLDPSNGNAVLGTASLAGAAPQLSFTNSQTLSTGNQPSITATGDFNGDGIPDLAIVNAGDQTISILLGNGDGTFRPAPNSPISVSGTVTALVVGDFNGDGEPDLAIDAASLQILLGKGDGTFGPAPPSSIPSFQSYAMAAGDFNGDGNLDLALGNISSATVTVLLGNGDGTFFQSAGAPPNLFSDITAMVAGDFNNDGQLDLAITANTDAANFTTQGWIEILLNNGDGTFRVAPTSPIAFGASLSSLAVADFNGDGEPDLAVVDKGAAAIYILIGHGDGAFTLGANLSGVTYYPQIVSVGDFNGDGEPDVIVTGIGYANVFLGNGDGTFIFPYPLGTVQPVNIGTASGVAVADFNGDGSSDWTATISGSNSLNVELSTLTETATATATGISPYGSGTHNVDASYSGDGNYAASTSATTGLTAEIVGPASVPLFNPPAGIYSSTQSVSIADASPGATIYYTTDGTTPTQNSTAYSGPIAVSPTETVEAIATAPGYVQSVTGVAIYSLPPMSATPAFSPAAGTYASPQTVAISDSTSGATIYYTTDGSTPTSSSPMVNGPLTVNSSETIKAMATATGYSQSLVVTAAYAIGTTPVVNSISPTSGPVGTLVTISGNSFGGTQGSSTVTVGGVPTTPSAWSANQIQFAIPATIGTGSQSLTVTVGGLSSGSEPFLVTPAITSIAPSSGFAGTSVRVEGTNFGAYANEISAITFNGQPAHVSNWTPTSIEATAPPQRSTTAGSGTANSGATTGPVVVATYNPSNNSTTLSNGVVFTVISTPTILALSPSNGAPGTSVTVTGFNFGDSQSSGTVTFNGVSSSPTSWNSQAIIVPVPVGATSGSVIVTVGGVASNSYPFTIGASVTSVIPTAGGIGTPVTITGTGFGSAQGNSTVDFNGVPAPITNWSNTSIVATVPIGATTGQFAIMVNGASISAGVFSVTPAINRLTPSSGIAGTVVTVSGSNFGVTQGTSTIYFGQVAAVPTQWSPNRIVAPVPTGAVTCTVIVTIAGQPSNSMPFTVGTGSITGVVTNASNGSAISGASIQALQANALIQTGSSGAGGSYTLSNLVAGNYDLLISAAGFGTTIVPGVAVTVGQPTAINVQLGSPGTIAGTITQSDGVTPVAGATVTIWSGTDSVAVATSGSAGAYSISSLSATTYSIQVSASGYNTVKESGVAVTAGNTSTANFSLASQTLITYTYDEVGRLVGITDSQKGSAAYSYDAVGNIVGIATTTPGQTSLLDFTPKSGPIGTSVTITGTDFSSSSQQDSVTLAGAAATVNSATSSQLIASVPAGATAGPITVSTPNGTVTSSASFTVTASSGVPAILSYSPQMANDDDAFEITGSGFDIASNDRVQVNGQSAVVYSATPTDLIAYFAPGNAGSGPISVSTPMGTAVGGDFFILPSPYTPSQVDFTGRMNVGGQFTGTINSSGDIGLVLFNGTSGQTINLQITGSTIANGTVSILNPNGSLLSQGQFGTGGTLIETVPPATSGTFTILIATNGTTSAGSLTLNLSSVAPTTIAPGVAQTVTITSAGQNAQRIFSGVAGQTVSVQLANSSFPGGCYSVTATILSPSGSPLASDNWCGQGAFFMNSALLTVSGTYTLVITPEVGGTGSINVTVNEIQQPTGTLSPGVPADLIVNASGQSANLTFAGTANQMASVLWSNCTQQGVSEGSCTSGTFNVLNPDGSTLSSTSVPGGTSYLVGPLTLPSTGTYSVVYTPESGSLGAAGVTVWLFNEQLGSISTTSPAPPAITINSPQQYMQLTFTGTAAQSLSIGLSNSNYKFSPCYVIAYCSVSVSILNPDGSELTSGQISYTNILFATNPPTSLSLGPVSLQQTGTYTIVITPSSTTNDPVNTGSASLTFSLQ